MLSLQKLLATNKPSHPAGHLITQLLPPHPHSPCRLSVCGSTPYSTPLSRCQAWIFRIPCVHDRPPNFPPSFGMHLQRTSSRAVASLNEATLKCAYDLVGERDSSAPLCLPFSDIYSLLSTVGTNETRGILRCVLSAFRIIAAFMPIRGRYLRSDAGKSLSRSIHRWRSFRIGSAKLRKLCVLPKYILDTHVRRTCCVFCGHIFVHTRSVA